MGYKEKIILEFSVDACSGCTAALLDVRSLSNLDVVMGTQNGNDVLSFSFTAAAEAENISAGENFRWDNDLLFDFGSVQLNIQPNQ